MVERSSMPVAAAVEAGVDGGLGPRGVGVELHAVGLDAHDRARVRGQQDVGDLREHRVGQVLDHQGHAVGLGPAEAEQRPGLRLAGLERHARPAQRRGPAGRAASRARSRP